MATVSQSGLFTLQAFTSAGALGAGMRLYFYTQGTTTKKDVYTDAAGSVPHTLTSDGVGGEYVALDARGELSAPIYLMSGAYDICLKTSAGATVWTRRADPMDDAYLGTHATGSVSETDGASGDVWLWTRQLTGSKTIGAGPLNGYSPSSYMFDVYTDDADAGADFMVGFRVRHLFGGTSMKGGREVLSGSGWLTTASNSSNTNRNYVGVQGKMLAQAGDNGTNTAAGAKGAIFGMGGAAYAYAAATNLLGIEGAEFNTFTQAGSSAKHMAGISVVGCQATRGATIDAAIRIGAQGAVDVFGPHGGWKHGIIFTDENGADPFYSGSTLIGSQFQVVKTVAAGIDLAGFTMTDYILRGIYSKLTELSLTLGDSSGNALIEVNGASTNGNLILTPKGTGVVSTGVNGYAISGIKVVGARDTGWTAMTGTPNEAATYDTASVTLAQLAGRVMALQTALTTHGLIGA